MDNIDGIYLQLFNKSSENDLWDLSCLFDDINLNNHINDTIHAKHIYFIKKYDNFIGIIYLLGFKHNKCLELEILMTEKYNNLYYKCHSFNLLKNIINNVSKNENETVQKIENDLKNHALFCVAHRYDKENLLFNYSNGYLIFNDLNYNYYLVNGYKEKMKNKVMHLLLKKNPK